MRLKYWLRAEADAGDGQGAGAGGASPSGDAIDAPPIVGAGDDGGTPSGDGKAAPPAAPATWPEKWRELGSDNDAKIAARLSRYASPKEVIKALIAAQNRIAAGDLKVSLGKDAKPEEIAAYREAHGIPDEPTKYDLTGLTIGDDDKPLVDKFLAAAHGAHMTPDHVRASLNAYAQISEDARNQRAALDLEVKEKAEDALRAEWGGEFRTNINMISNLLDTAPQGVRDKLLHGRLSDGTPIGSSPEVLQFLASLARERNPSGVVVPSGVATESAVEDEIAKIEKVLRTDRAAYNRDEKMQSRYRELLQWREGQRSKAA